MNSRPLRDILYIRCKHWSGRRSGSPRGWRFFAVSAPARLLGEAGPFWRVGADAQAVEGGGDALHVLPDPVSKLLPGGGPRLGALVLMGGVALMTPPYVALVLAGVSLAILVILDWHYPSEL